jgi:hypothetical protein
MPIWCMNFALVPAHLLIRPYPPILCSWNCTSLSLCLNLNNLKAMAATWHTYSETILGYDFWQYFQAWHRHWNEFKTWVLWRWLLPPECKEFTSVCFSFMTPSAYLLGLEHTSPHIYTLWEQLPSNADQLICLNIKQWLCDEAANYWQRLFLIQPFWVL